MDKQNLRLCIMLILLGILGLIDPNYFFTTIIACGIVGIIASITN